MKLKEIGEFGFIERFKPHFEELLKDGLTGIGDDCAILSANEEEDWLISTDLLMEDVHFLRNAISPYQLGNKSLAVNLSDIAAMGGEPIASFLSIAVPKDLEVEYLDEFMRGYHGMSSKYNTALLGGDTTHSLKNLAINVVVIGKCDKGKARKRSDAKQNDIICVTGNLGDSAGGLRLLLDKIPPGVEEEKLLVKHHLPEPQIQEGMFLSRFDGIHAMMDISDGIASDLKHMLQASHVGAVIDLDIVPVSESLTCLSKKYGWNTLHLAISGGEDYELLLTVDPDFFESIKMEFENRFQKPLIQIGEIKQSFDPIIDWLEKGKKVDLHEDGFNHFK